MLVRKAPGLDKVKKIYLYIGQSRIIDFLA